MLKTKTKFIVRKVAYFKRKNNTYTQELNQTDFRVTIFGSARIKGNAKTYKNVFSLAKTVAEHGFDVVTGGGPGLMEAANAGHAAGDKKNRSDNIGLAIKLPHEQHDNEFLELKRHFARFSDRLDNFMALSSCVVVMPGGVGTCLEFFYTWQLIQVKHINPIPIILVGNMWEKLLNWIKKYPLKNGLISPKEMDCVHIAKNNKEAMKIILKTHREFLKGHKNGNNHYLDR